MCPGETNGPSPSPKEVHSLAGNQMLGLRTIIMLHTKGKCWKKHPCKLLRRLQEEMGNASQAGVWKDD